MARRRQHHRITARSRLPPLAARQERGLPSRLSQFFTQWFDTAYPSGGGTSKPAITGPGLAGPGFYTSSCRA